MRFLQRLYRLSVAGDRAMHASNGPTDGAIREGMRSTAAWNRGSSRRSGAVEIRMRRRVSRRAPFGKRSASFAVRMAPFNG